MPSRHERKVGIFSSSATPLVYQQNTKTMPAPISNLRQRAYDHLQRKLLSGEEKAFKKR